MNSHWLPSGILRVASILTPGDQRAEWIEEWQSELWYVPQCEAMRFSLGAFSDAFWLRRNNKNPVKRPRTHLESPVSCLVLVATLAVVSMAVAVRLESRLPFPQAHGTAALRGLGEMAFLYVLLGTMGLMIGDCPGSRSPVAVRNRARTWVFLALKIALALPILQGTLVTIVAMDVPPLTLGFFAGYVLLFRWIFTDQRRRCPVCLRLLTKPVRIGTSSQTFLDWYGAESMCSRGHGLLYVPEIGASYSRQQEWLRLETAGTR